MLAGLLHLPSLGSAAAGQPLLTRLREIHATVLDKDQVFSISRTLGELDRFEAEALMHRRLALAQERGDDGKTERAKRDLQELHDRMRK